MSNTGTTCGVLPAAAEATVTVPLYVPGDMPLVFTDTLTAPGVVPAFESILNQPPDTATAVKFAGRETPSAVWLDKDRRSGAGAWHPIWKGNASIAGKTDKRMSGTFSVTGILTGLLDAVLEVITTLPV